LGEQLLETNDLIRLFKGHNLTKNQSIVFATLVQKKSYLTAKEISQFSNLARETIYKVLFDLKEKGLVQKSITKPKKYCSIPLKNALQFFWQAKNHQIHELKILQKNVLRKYDHSAKINPIQKKPQFILVPRKVEFSKRVEKSISESKELVRVITSSKRHLQAVAAFEKAISKVLHMGVKFQVLINDESDGVENSSKTKTFYDNPKT
jgi:sugar-specific transcriptional regulator TrmB